MKLNNKGFAISTFMYMLLILAIILILATLAILSSRRMIIEKQKNTALDNISYSQNKICESVSGLKSLKPGTEYKCEVKNGTFFNFYVLSTEGTKVNLIMDRNICSDGTVASSSNQCNYAWHFLTQELDDDNNNYGPDIAMTNLYNATKSWTNVPDMIMNYDDENNNGTNNGYTGIKTNNGITTITGKQNKTSTSQTFGTSSEPLKARLPRQDEVFKEEQDSNYCNYDSASCPTWLVENLHIDSAFSWCSECSTKYVNTQRISGIIGYWLLSSSSSTNNYARLVECSGTVGDYSVSYASEYGIRPVITVPKSMLK